MSPLSEKGVVVKSVEKGSAAYEAGIRKGMIIKKINEFEIKNMQDYSNAIKNIFSNLTNFTKITVKTKTDEYVFF